MSAVVVSLCSYKDSLITLKKIKQNGLFCSNNKNWNVIQIQKIMKKTNKWSQYEHLCLVKLSETLDFKKVKVHKLREFYFLLNMNHVHLMSNSIGSLALTPDCEIWLVV